MSIPYSLFPKLKHHIRSQLLHQFRIRVGDLLQLGEVADGAFLLAMSQDQLGQVGIDVRVRNQLLVSGGVDVQLLDFLSVDIQIILQFDRVDVLHHINLLQLGIAVETAEFFAVLHELGGAFAAELRYCEQIVGVATVEVDFDDIVHRFPLLLSERRQRVGADVGPTLVILCSLFLPDLRQGVGKPLLLLGKCLEQGFVLVNIVGRLTMVLIEKVEDVARQHHGEQKQGGSPFASGKVEFRFHTAKIQSRNRGCQEGTKGFCQQGDVDKKIKTKSCL